jgi:hypothetical protein
VLPGPYSYGSRNAILERRPDLVLIDIIDQDGTLGSRGRYTARRRRCAAARLEGTRWHQDRGCRQKAGVDTARRAIQVPAR